jgi:hypothetical protein
VAKLVPLVVCEVERVDVRSSPVEELGFNEFACQWRTDQTEDSEKVLSVEDGLDVGTCSTEGVGGGGAAVDVFLVDPVAAGVGLGLRHWLRSWRSSWR